MATDQRGRANPAHRHPDAFSRLEREWEAWSASMLPITPDVRTHGVNGKVQADHYHADGTD